MFGFDVVLQNWTVQKLPVAFGTIISFSSVESTFMMPIRLFWRQYHFAVVAIKMFIHSSLFLTWNPKMVGKSGFWDKCFVALSTFCLRFVQMLICNVAHQFFLPRILLVATFAFELRSFMNRLPMMAHVLFFLNTLSHISHTKCLSVDLNCWFIIETKLPWIWAISYPCFADRCFRIDEYDCWQNMHSTSFLINCR